MDSGGGCSAGAGLCHRVLSRRCCQWAVSASSLTATSTRRPTAATSWGSALTCRSPPTYCPQVRPSLVGPSPAPQGSEVELRLSHGSEDAACSSRRTSFPGGFGPLFSVFKTGEGWTEQPPSKGSLLGVVLGGRQIIVTGVETAQMGVRGLSCYAESVMTRLGRRLFSYKCLKSYPALTFTSESQESDEHPFLLV